MYRYRVRIELEAPDDATALAALARMAEVTELEVNGAELLCEDEQPYRTFRSVHSEGVLYGS